MLIVKLLVLGCVALPLQVVANFSSNCAENRRVIVHLFEWRWQDIAEECERFLSPKGYCGVQVSPPNENRIVTSPMRPWYERYQPVSYKLSTRSGTESEFIDMVRRCNNVGVRIYVDAILNHMATFDAGRGTGTGGTEFNTRRFSFPGVPWTSRDFHHKGIDCFTKSGNIENYMDASQVRNCRLEGLTDLKQNIGVAGFRFDAAKHMWPNDLKAIITGLDTLATRWFEPGSTPFIYQEVIDPGYEPIKASQYYYYAPVTEFNYGKYLSKAFLGQIHLKELKTFGAGWGGILMPDRSALVFIDNHDNQRNHGGGGDILSFFRPRSYKMAVTFMLAWPYGTPRVMSSYFWKRVFVNGNDVNNWVGPPSDQDYNIKPVTIKEDGSCGNGWICEHRWKCIANMIEFSNLAGKLPVMNWWDNGQNQIAFSRGNKAFFAVNSGSTLMFQRLRVNLRPGKYCDVISGEISANGQDCTGRSILVARDKTAVVFIWPSGSEPMIAIHSGSFLAEDYGDDTELSSHLLCELLRFQHQFLLILFLIHLIFTFDLLIDHNNSTLIFDNLKHFARRIQPNLDVFKPVSAILAVSLIFLINY